MLDLAPPPLETRYTREQSEDDARTSGLEAAALFDQVNELHAKLLCDASRNGQVSNGMSLLDRARQMAGVFVEPPAEEQPPPPPTSTTPALPGAAGAEPAATPSRWDLVRARALPAVGSPHAITSVAAAAEAAIEAKIEKEIEERKPLETSRVRRTMQHISATVQPLIGPLSQVAVVAGSGSSSVAAAATVSMAGMAAVGGLTQSMATHEHHSQAQDMSRRLQRVALEQDRKLHAEARAMAASQHEQALGQETRLHRQALWRSQQQHTQSLRTERDMHDTSLRVSHRLHFEGILADLREQVRRGCPRRAAACPPRVRCVSAACPLRVRCVPAGVLTERAPQLRARRRAYGACTAPAGRPAVLHASPARPLPTVTCRRRTVPRRYVPFHAVTYRWASGPRGGPRPVGAEDGALPAAAHRVRPAARRRLHDLRRGVLPPPTPPPPPPPPQARRAWF